MCVILDMPKNVLVSNETLELGHFNNPHGFGIFFPTKNGKVHVHKIMPTKFDDVLKVWNLYKDYDAPKSVHFRFKTKGEIDRTNVHPFRILSKAEHGREIWCMHNGTISDAPSIVDSKSDTWNFIEYILRPILAKNPELIDDKDFQTLVEAMLKGDRMLLLDGEVGDTIRLNPTKSGGHVTKEGVWVSNNYGLKDTYSDYLDYGLYGSGQSGVGTGTGSTYNTYHKKQTDPDLIGTTIKVYNAHKSLITQRYDKGGEVEILREITGFLKDGNLNEVDLGLRFSIKNTGIIPLDRIGMRSNLTNLLTDKLTNIRLSGYKVRGQLSEAINFTPSFLYCNTKHVDRLNPGMGGIIEIQISAKFNGDKAAFLEFGGVDLSKFYVDVGYMKNLSEVKYNNTIEGSEDDTPPWTLSEEELADEIETKAAEKLAEHELSPAANDDNKILYYDFNSNPDWEIDYEVLNSMSHEELVDITRNQPEYIADFLKEFLDAF